MGRACFPFFLLVVALLTHSEVPASAAPKIELENMAFVFKEIIEGQTVEHVYQFQNRGDQPLEIQRVRPG